MKKTLSELKEKAQKLTLSQTVYPALSAIFVILIIVLFILAVRTISTLINGTVTEGPSTSEASAVDSEEFLVVARKLGIPQEAGMPTSVVPIEQPETTLVVPPQETLPVLTSTGSTTATLDPKELTIAIYNGTTIKGSASRLKALIEKEGFVVAHTGNASKPATKMTLELRGSKSAYQDLLVQALGEIYAPEVITSDLPEDGTYDAIITIGEAQ